ncbi:hypothetical protein [uncultured Shewanella sp.]|uniref:hypothetical protein n=1 Tax=uncultured Shewanella sp. TaxID=173975 RepID=UPI00260F157A|nr:hypothetical protein [uncultured Shewanella sp.]
MSMDMSIATNHASQFIDNQTSIATHQHLPITELMTSTIASINSAMSARTKRQVTERVN